MVDIVESDEDYSSDDDTGFERAFAAEQKARRLAKGQKEDAPSCWTPRMIVLTFLTFVCVMYLVKLRLDDQLSGYDAQGSDADAPQEDPYEALGVSKTATARDIKKAYRKLALQFHPDHNSSAAAADRFRSVNAAHTLLSDKERRKQYDSMAASFKTLESEHSVQLTTGNFDELVATSDDLWVIQVSASMYAHASWFRVCERLCLYVYACVLCRSACTTPAALTTIALLDDPRNPNNVGI